MCPLAGGPGRDPCASAAGSGLGQDAAAGLSPSAAPAWALRCQAEGRGVLRRVNPPVPPKLEEFAHFDFGVWRKRYMQWISQMKSRVLDVFRGIDRDQDGRISQREFIESVLSSSEHQGLGLRAPGVPSWAWGARLGVLAPGGNGLCSGHRGLVPTLAGGLRIPVLPRVPHQRPGDDGCGQHLRHER